MGVAADSGPVHYAFVAINMDGALMGSAFTDVSGDAGVYIEPSSPGVATIIMTGRNLMTTDHELMIMAAGCGFITMDQDLYNCDQLINVVLWDADLNVDPNTIEVATAQIHSDSEPAPETIILTESKPSTSEFHGNIMTSDVNSGPDYLLVSDGDVITLHYQDADCEGLPADVYDYAGVDCAGPGISGVMVSDVTVESALIGWMTDENSTTTVFWGDTTPPVNELE